ncbi:ABC transporter permease [Companilactobacillus mindensis]|nr:ABC transporter permease [Companilactobacillus mindensis]GEO77728.1 antibiotic ABC transporter permease [Companilactobacillus mindensis]
MRTISIAKRVTRELFRDKRTLMLMFLAPILVLFLMKLVFSTNSSTNVDLATVNVNTSLVKTLDKVSHVDTHKYTTDKKAQNALTKIQSQLPNQAPKKQTQSKIINHYQYGNSDTNFFDKIVPILMGFFVFFFVFLISGMALLNERTSGTLNRLLATPVKRSEIVFGYMLSYGGLAIIQTLIIVLFTVWALKVEVVGNILYVILINFILALVALAFGILMSTFAKSEFQMMQFIPLVIVPQVFFSGIIPLDTMANGVKVISYILPLKYAGDALSGIVMSGNGFLQILPDIGILLVFLVILTVMNILGLKKYRKV